jgi:hypothetical protein
MVSWGGIGMCRALVLGDGLNREAVSRVCMKALGSIAGRRRLIVGSSFGAQGWREDLGMADGVRDHLRQETGQADTDSLVVVRDM